MLKLIIDNTLPAPSQKRLLTEEEEQENILEMLLTQGLKNKTPLLLGSQWRLIDNALLL
jgi:hypothetical protein